MGLGSWLWDWVVSPRIKGVTLPEPAFEIPDERPAVLSASRTSVVSGFSTNRITENKWGFRFTDETSRVGVPNDLEDREVKHHG